MTSPHRLRSRCLFLGLGALCVAAPSGCTGQDLNDRTVLGGVVTIPALQPQPSTARSEMQSDFPSLRSVNRTEWAPRRFLVPVDGTVHKPIRRWAFTAAGGNARRTGLWPTLESSLWVNEKPRNPIIVEGLTAWIEALGELKLLGLEIVRSPAIGAGGRRASPWAMYKRYPETGEWTNASPSHAEDTPKDHE